MYFNICILFTSFIYLCQIQIWVWIFELCFKLKSNAWYVLASKFFNYTIRTVKIKTIIIDNKVVGPEKLLLFATLLLSSASSASAVSFNEASLVTTSVAHCGTLKMSKAPRNLGSACQIFFWPKSLLMGIYMWEKVEKVVPFNVPGLQDPQRELL